ncbi:WG repeat-containing protein [Sphingobacteriales bacterium UPWRP_1]|nr:hypothetical protein BVG80_11870 [Sphingobacteriales bacterium TSM_CSM]PSJ77922.1 WG repeat-containing protein [Sphingobacteriales bacterium UPWRP_1]
MHPFFTLLLLVFGTLLCCQSCTQQTTAPGLPAQNNTATTDTAIWYLAKNDSANTVAYLNAKGDTMIAAGKYTTAFTDTFRSFAIVYQPERGFLGINKKGQTLFEVLAYDNGPDYPQNGLFRITRNGKIGYANLRGKEVIPPQFDCAYPFENGRAKVSLQCTQKPDGEHTVWQSNSWYYIDLNGKKANPPQK